MMHFVRRLPVPIGGLLRFSDGVNVAKELKDKNPTAFDMLTQYPIQFIDSGTDVLGDFDVESWHYPIRSVGNTVVCVGMWPKLSIIGFPVLVVSAVKCPLYFQPSN
jgi:hypothetical protein